MIVIRNPFLALVNAARDILPGHARIYGICKTHLESKGSGGADDGAGHSAWGRAGTALARTQDIERRLVKLRERLAMRDPDNRSFRQSFDEEPV